jgi:soluble lytic murein transglycosylase-like protein
MNLGLWTFRTPARQQRFFVAAAVVLAATIVALSLPLVAQSPQPVEEDGHVVWTNDNPELPAEDASGHAAQKQYVYWSNTEHRWKPVRAASPRALRSARRVAGEVSSYIQSRPVLNSAGAARAQVEGKLAAEDPNYAEAAGNRSVSAAQIDRYIDEAAVRHHVDPNLVRALVKVESNFNPRAVSSKGAMGLMQLMPATARRYDVSDPFDAAQNVDAGVRHLKGLLDDFGGDVPLTLAAYNAGEGAVERSGGIPPYTETRNYVRRITGILASDETPSAARAGSPARHVAAAPPPIEMYRDARGTLVISNMN